MTSTVLVTGATGNVGSKVVQELAAAGIRVRAFVRNPRKAAAVLGEVELAVGDYADPASVARAMAGVDRVFLNPVNSPEQVEQERAVIDAATGAGASRVVKLSGLDARIGSPLPALDWHARAEQYLRAASIPAVILQANWFMSNLLAAAGSVRRSGRLFAPAGGGRVSMVDPRDVAAAAAAALTGQDQDRRSYRLTGGAAITYHDVAAALTVAVGRQVDYVDVPEDAARQAMTADGLPDWLVTHLIGAYRLIRRGELGSVTDDVCILTGRKPRTFAEFAREHAGGFSGTVDRPWLPSRPGP